MDTKEGLMLSRGRFAMILKLGGARETKPPEEDLFAVVILSVIKSRRVISLSLKG